MSKSRFIQAVFIRALPPKDKFDSCLAHAEEMWGYLSSYAHGDAGESKARESKDWYTSLDERSQKFFCAFWVNFGYKKGRNNAAMRWHQLGNLSNEQYQQIVDAAKKEAERQLPAGQVRKMAEGWLFEKRYEDFKPEEKTASSQKNHVLTHLAGNLKHLEMLYEKGRDPKLLEQINKLKREIAAAQGGK
jgi:hypothetical protein